MKKISIIIPVYNSEKALEELASRIKNVFNNINFNYELIFVDDFSPNKDTWPTLLNLKKCYKEVKIIQLMRNFGQQSATLCGIENATGDYILTMDDDLQHSPEDIPKLLSQRSHDIVFAQLINKKHTIFKRISSYLKGWFDVIIIKKPRNINLSSFRLMNKKVADGILKIKTPYPFIPAIMFYISKDIKGVEVKHSSRKEGRSTYTLWKMIKLFSNLIINNSSFLLRLIAIMGLLIASISLFGVIWLLYKKLAIGISVQGWTSLILVTIFGFGLLFFTIGITGEYLIRIISTIEKKPTYVIRYKIDN